MKKISDYNFNISKILLSILVTGDISERVHRNRPCYGIVFVLSGSIKYRFLSGETFTANKNDLVFLPKNSSYDSFFSDSDSCYAINFDLDYDEEFSPCVIKLKNSSKTEQYFQKAVNVWKSKQVGYEMKCKAELYNILYSVQQEHLFAYLSKNKIEIIKPAIEYIHENYLSSNISIEFVSHMCNITPEYFRKIFKSFFGQSPIAYINNLKIQNAKQLLSSKLYSVTDAALMSGFTDISHFSREFKKHTDISPREYLKRQM